VQFINLEEQTTLKAFKIRDIKKMFGNAPKIHPKGDPRGKEFNPTNVEIVVQTQEERVKEFLVTRSFNNKIHNDMLAKALLGKGAPNPIYDEFGKNQGFK